MYLYHVLFTLINIYGIDCQKKKKKKKDGYSAEICQIVA
jgi:hypothetical protein